MPENKEIVPERKRFVNYKQKLIVPAFTKIRRNEITRYTDQDNIFSKNEYGVRPADRHLRHLCKFKWTKCVDTAKGWYCKCCYGNKKSLSSSVDTSLNLTWINRIICIIFAFKWLSVFEWMWTCLWFAKSTGNKNCTYKTFFVYTWLLAHRQFFFLIKTNFVKYFCSLLEHILWKKFSNWKPLPMYSLFSCTCKFNLSQVLVVSLLSFFINRKSSIV